MASSEACEGHECRRRRFQQCLLTGEQDSTSARFPWRVRAYLVQKMGSAQRPLSQKRLICLHLLITIVALGNTSPPPEYRQSAVEPDRTRDQGVNLGFLKSMSVAILCPHSHHLSHFIDRKSIHVRMPWSCSYISLEGENSSRPPCEHC